MVCPSCDTASWTGFLTARDMYTGDPYEIVRCVRCGLIRTDGPPSSPPMYVYDGAADAGARFGPAQWLLRWFRRARVREFAGRRPGRALDVGCGDGSFLEGLARSGWDVFGTELSPLIAASAIQRFGDRIYIGELDKMPYPEASFDLITFWHVLEHLADPRKALAEARRLIKMDGTVLIAVPNIRSLQAHFFKQDWLHLDVPRHRWHFEPRTLARLADRCEFQVERVRHFSAEYGPFGIIQGLATKLGGGHLLFTSLMRRSPFTHVREMSFWLHVALVILAILPSVVVEGLASLAKRGGAMVVVLKPRG